jgi:hypothetical protein
MDELYLNRFAEFWLPKKPYKMKRDALTEVAREFGIATENGSVSKAAMVEKVNEWINTDFQKLVSVLYRIDVNEEKLRQLLEHHHDTDAALVITNAIIERQEQKIKSRRNSPRRENNIDENEKW